MKVTLYTVKDCQFSKQEKDYLTTNKITFEEKDLESNREFLTEMLTLSNNFAGTPVTKVEKDDGQITVLKGFTKEEFDKALGLSQSDTAPEPQTEEKKPEEPVSTPATDQPTVPTTPADQPATPVSPTEPPQQPPTPPQEAKTNDDALNAILTDLQKNMTTAEPNQPQQPNQPAPASIPTPSQPPVSNPTQPQTPPQQPQVPQIPQIPDFPAK